MVNPNDPSPATTDSRTLDSLDDQGLAAALARGAGERLLALRCEADAGKWHSGTGFDERSFKDAGDTVSQRWLAEALALARPKDVILSEEATDDAARVTADRVWIIDPLDGTREFSERHADGTWRTDWAVHVALWEKGQGLTEGAVALPARGQLFSTAGADQAACRTDTADTKIRVATSRTRPPSIVADLARTGLIEPVPMGSAGVKALAVVTGECDAYLHDGGQYEWDSAAPVAVAKAHGLIATRLAGNDLAYNQPNPWLPDLLVATRRVAPALRRAADEWLATRQEA